RYGVENPFKTLTSLEQVSYTVFLIFLRRSFYVAHFFIATMAHILLAICRKITKVEDHTGRYVTYSYNPYKGLNKFTNADGKYMTYAWDTQKRIISKTDFKGVTQVTN